MDIITGGGAISLLVFGAGVLIATRLIYRSNSGSGGSTELLLKLAPAVMITVGMMGLCFKLAGLLGLVICFAYCLVAGMTQVQLRINQQRSLLDLLALAAEKQMPLSSIVRAFVADQPVRSRRRMRKFEADLQLGVPLGEALSRTRSLLPRQMIVAARLGERTGTLKSALRHAARAYALGVPIRQAIATRIFYLVCVILAIQLAFAFIAIQIFPSLVRIFEDFEIPLPTMTVLAFTLVNNEVVQLIGIFGPLFGLAAFAYVALYFVGVAPAPTFGLGLWLERGPVLRSLALVVESQAPLGEALVGLADGYPSRSISRRLRKAGADVLAGGQWTQTLVKYSLIGQNAAAVMQSAQRVGNLPWAMRQVAEASDRRLAYRLEAALNIISPLLILGLGGVVGLFVIGCFLPLVKMIMALT